MTNESKSKLLAAWQWLKGWSYKYIGGLFMEEKNGKMTISIGRCMLIAVLIWMFSFWASWRGAAAVTPEELAQLVLDNLPRQREIFPMDVETAAERVIDAMPSSSTPPLLETAFLTSCTYVFGSKVSTILGQKLNGK